MFGSFENKMNYCAPFSIHFAVVTLQIKIIHNLCVAVDVCMQIDITCIHFGKAFGRVSHCKLLFKLCNTGISENVLNWIGGYLGNRQQAFGAGDAMSENREVYSGVP